ncbi:MAG TPA: FkbM family methyltransferase [Ignavibacteria bacterium]|nr:FkbM family methyltransferase [Ignavibacteria bacterium]
MSTLKLYLYRLLGIPVRLYKKLKRFFKRFVRKTHLSRDKPIGSIGLQLYDLALRGFKCKYILDVGAHSAEWARTAKEFFPGSTIYLIEPLEEMEINLKEFCNEYPPSKYFLNGAGAAEGILYLTTEKELAGANFLQDENTYLKSSKVQREVKIITINSLIEKKEIEIPELVKLDVQGFELEVLKGSEILFGKTEVFILEVSFFEFIKGTPLFSEVVKFMAERGYEVYDFPGFLRRPFDNALGQIDITFVKKEGFFRNSDLWQ